MGVINDFLTVTIKAYYSLIGNYLLILNYPVK
jgi:hypothetical protein